MTGYGRNMVKSFGALINRHYPHHRVTMGTVTIPPMNADQRRTLVEKWPELVRQQLQALRRRLEAKGLPELVCSVTEIQPKRLTSTGEGYLHLHILWLNEPGRKGNWSVDPGWLRSRINDWLYRQIPGYQGGHVNVNVKPVEGEIARYMAKYMSKGSAQLAEAQEDWGEDVTPSTWWNMTATARQWVKAHVAKGFDVGRLLESFVEYAFQTTPDDLFAFLAHVEIEFDGVNVTVGWRGRLHPQVYEDAKGMLRGEC